MRGTVWGAAVASEAPPNIQVFVALRALSACACLHRIHAGVHLLRLGCFYPGLHLLHFGLLRPA
jgi:hypothetical protein